MKVYTLLRLNNLIKSHRIKFFGLYLLHKLNRRYLAVNFDPVNACNLRCQMCYFTDKDYVKKLKGIFNPEELPQLGEAILKRALKFQIGCGTEPTLYKNLDDVFRLAKEYDVPHVSLTTNGNLITKEKLKLWVDCGLNEVILSLHGVHRDTYEDMMKGDYDKFKNALLAITELKKSNPSLSLRINYTFNEDNFEELVDFFKAYGDFDIDVIQLRPIKSMGNTEYQNFSMEKVIPVYEKVLGIFKEESAKRGVTLLATPPNKLSQPKSENSVVTNYTYCYISPTHFWRKDFDWKNESFNAYSKRTGWAKELFGKALNPKEKLEHLKTETLNYAVDIN